MTIEDKRLEKILRCIGELTEALRKDGDDRTIRERIDLNYYIRKEEELKMLRKRVDEVLGLLKFVQENLGAEYKEVYNRWSKDARWLNIYLTGTHPQQDPVGKRVSVL